MKSVNQLMSARAQAAVRENERLLSVISRIVPAAVIPHICFCRLQEGVLKITLDNASWVSRLRFCKSQIVDELSAEFGQVADVTWHVLPTEIEPTKRTSKRPAIKKSNAAAKTMRRTAGSVDDERLKQALLETAEKLDE